MVHSKKSFSIFPSPAQQDVTYQSLPIAGNNLYMTSLFPPCENLVSDILLGMGISKSFFYGVLRVLFFSIPIWEMTRVIIGLAARGIFKGTQE
jgi:hypothetical protein